MDLIDRIFITIMIIGLLFGVMCAMYRISKLETKVKDISDSLEVHIFESHAEGN